VAKKLEEYSKDELIYAVKHLRRNKKFGLVWEENIKPETVVIQCQNELPVLEEVTSLAISKSPGAPTNLIIEGDNYHSLSVLNYTHKGKIDVIYIDPPYNTGKQDFKYNDKWVDEEDSYRHSKWLAFMNRRLRLAYNLLSTNGIMVISIDDNEMAPLKLLCDEIFGEKNRLSTHHIQVRYGNKSLNERKDFQELIEYALIYTKNKNFSANKPLEDYDLSKFNLEIKELTKPDKTLVINGKKVDVFRAGSYSIEKKGGGNIDLFKETWLSGSIYSGTGHGKTYQKIIEPRVDEDGLSTLYKIYGLGEDGLGYRYMINPQRQSSSRGKMFTKVPTDKRLSIESGDMDTAKPIINFYDFSPDFGNIRHEGGVAFNSGKKPVKMLKQLINYHKKKNAIVLDFFAGSGSTAQAVLALNEEDGGIRKFIVATNNEGKIASDITYPRIKNVINGYNGTPGIPSNVRYFKTAFVPKSNVSDDTRYELVQRSCEMICVREDTFEPVVSKAEFKIYKNDNHYTAIIFDVDHIGGLKDKLSKLENQPVNIYVFTLTNDTYSEDFLDIKQKHVLCPIPESILEVYRKIFREKIWN
jgi:adenine-specific DNA-methyltransferase